MENFIAKENYEFKVLDKNEKICILISSLSLGGAEKIVKDWALSEAKRGRKVEIGVIHSKDKEHNINHENIKILRRTGSVENFLLILSKKWENEVVSTHLLNDNIYKFLWEQKMKTVPVIHNDKKGWKNPAKLFNNKYVLQVVACADYVKNQLLENGLNKKIVVVKHLPLISNTVLNEELRKKERKRLHIKDDTIVIGAIGAIKEQKNYIQLIEIAKSLPENYCFLIFGGEINKESKEIKEFMLEKMDEFDLYGKIFFMGFQEEIYQFYPMLDAVINCSSYEGYSIATQEALISGIPVIANAVSGQTEINLSGLTLIENNNVENFISEIKKLTVRKKLECLKVENTTRLWTLTTAIKEPKKKSLIEKILKKKRVLFLTANLNAGGAQRSLVNLTTGLKNKINGKIEVAVCNGASHEYFPKQLEKNKVDFYRLSNSRDVYDLTKVLLEKITEENIDTVCLWNVDPKVKLLLTGFISENVKLVDVSPGAYAFEELAAIENFQNSIQIKESDFYNRLDELVLKFNADTSFVDKYNLKTTIIQNGVKNWSKKETNENNKNILVSGRLVDSKYPLEIIEAFKKFNKENNQEYTLNFYGDAEERNASLLDEIKKSIKDEKIILHGSDPYLTFLADRFAFTIVLGKHQGCPNAVLEAASAEIAVLSNDSGGTREIIKDNVSGVLISESFTIDDIYNGMKKIESLNKDKLIKNAKNIIEQNFSMKKMIEKYKKTL